jgi:glycosyltransferase involved in cell wall biosynthesis
MTKVIVGIPAYNEENSIAEVVGRCLEHASSVVVVDDGSTDATSFRAYGAGAVVIRHHGNHGKGAAIVTLFDYALADGADILVLIDGDGQHDPAEMPTVIAPVLSGGADMVVGSRFIAGTSTTPKIRRLGQYVFNALTAAASGVPCSDSQSGFRAFSRMALCAMRLSESSFSVECEMQFECKVRGLYVAEAPITCSYEAPPKRNILRHGGGVLARLGSMMVRRRIFNRVPMINTPVALHHAPVTAEVADSLTASAAD